MMKHITHADAQWLANMMGVYIGRSYTGLVMWYKNEPRQNQRTFKAQDRFYGQLFVEIDVPGVWLWRPE